MGRMPVVVCLLRVSSFLWCCSSVSALRFALFFQAPDGAGERSANRKVLISAWQWKHRSLRGFYLTAGGKSPRLSPSLPLLKLVSARCVFAAGVYRCRKRKFLSPKSHNEQRAARATPLLRTLERLLSARLTNRNWPITAAAVPAFERHTHFVHHCRLNYPY